MQPNHRMFSKSADKILDIFYDVRIADTDLMHVAFYTVIQSEHPDVINKILEFADHVRQERDRVSESNQSLTYLHAADRMRA